MNAVEARSDGHQPSTASWVVLGAMRDGSLRAEVEYDVLALSGRLDLDPAGLRAALRWLADLGIVRMGRGGAVRFGVLSIPTWAANSWHLIGLMEGVIRSSVDVLTGADVNYYADLVDAARRRSMERVPEFDAAFWATISFWIERTPNRALAQLATRAAERVRFGMSPSVPFRVWDSEDWLAGSLQVVRFRTHAHAEDAAHSLARLWATQMRASAEILQVNPDQIAGPAADADDLPGWASWKADEFWWSLLASVRDGTLEYRRPYSVREIAALLRVPRQSIAAHLERLTLMGLLVQDAKTLDVVHLREPDVQHWVDSLQLAHTLEESAASWTIPSLSETDQAELRSIISRALRQARSRDFGLTVTLVEIMRYVSDRCPNSFIRATALLALSRLAFALPEAPVFRQWNLDDFLLLLDEAVTTRSRTATIEAMHALATHHDAHVLDVSTRLRASPDHS